MVVRMQQGATPGSCAQHSQSLEALLCHIPGSKVGLRSNAQGAYSMLLAAIADPGLGQKLGRRLGEAPGQRGQGRTFAVHALLGSRKRQPHASAG